VAAMATVKRELGSVKGAVYVMLYQIGIAWLAAFCFYQIVSLLR
jgi:Fe2+ transport system protein B